MPTNATQRRSGLIIHWRARDLSLTPITGQTATMTATATGTVPDAAAVSYSVVHSQPRWGWDATEAYPYLRMTSREQLYWAMNLTPKAMTVYLAFVEQGTVEGTAADKLFHLGHQTTETTDARFYVDTTGTYYRILHDNGTALPTATLSAAPSVGDPCEIRAVLNTDGSVLIGQSVNGAAETTASDATTATLQSTWAGPYLHLNGIGAANQGDGIDFRCVKILPGVRTMAECRTAF
jgi:hypothetical protein